MSFFVFYTFLSALIMVQCQEFLHKETGPHKFTELDRCDRVMKALRENRRHASLMPRERLVALIAEPGFEFNPRTVTVKRCNGFCPGRRSPMPIKTKPMHKIVHLHQEGNLTAERCVKVEVQEHMECKCMCMRSAEECLPSQKWIPGSCSCQCIDRDKKKSRCKTQLGMEWYEDDCSCACTQKIMECRTGKRWNKEECRRNNKDCSPAAEEYANQYRLFRAACGSKFIKGTGDIQRVRIPNVDILDEAYAAIQGASYLGLGYLISIMKH